MDPYLRAINHVKRVVGSDPIRQEVLVMCFRYAPRPLFVRYPNALVRMTADSGFQQVQRLTLLR